MSKAADVNCDGDSSSADEYDNNKSFVKKVKSRVSGFIPSSLTKWFGAKVRQRQDLDDDEEDDTYELQPPSKRVKKGSSDNLFDMNIISTPIHGQQHNPFSTTDPFREPVPGPSQLKARKLVLPASNHFNQIQVDQTNGVDSDSGESTSGYSSMPRIGSKEQVSEIPDRIRMSTQPTLHNDTSSNQNRSIFNTSIPHERSLFADRVSSPQKSNNTSLSSRRPSFNASAFGAPNFMDKTLSTRRIVNSPFYNGRITYGGASAYNRILNISNDQHSNTIQPKLVNEIKSTALSKTAKRILDTLEQYTSPVQDVRRIPHPAGRSKSQKPLGLIGKYVGANPYMVRETQMSNKVPSNKELQVPTMTDLLKMKLKERLQDSTSSVREMANNSSSSLNAEEYSIRTIDDDKQPAGKSTNKMKTKVASVRQKSNVYHETVPEVKLPDIQLPISTLPSFNFSIPPSSKPLPVSTASASKPVEASVAAPAAEKSDKNTSIFNRSSTELTFNSFKNATSPPPLFSKASSSATTIPAINFKSPEVKPSPFASSLSFVSKPTTIPAIVQEKLQTQKKDATSVVEFKFSKPLIIAENNLKSIKAINNFKFSKPLVKKACNGVTETVNAKETITTKSLLPANSFGDQFKMSSDKWECSVCLVRNEITVKACVSCTTPKPVEKSLNGTAKSSAAGLPSFSSWGDKYKAPSNTWECSMCMVRNDAEKTKCLACENPKTSAATVAPVVGSIEGFKKKDDEWECSSCMVRNSSSKQKCVCCETPKPTGAKLVPTTAANASPLGSTTSSWGDKFKAPSSTWECSMCLVRNDLVKDKCVACENPRPAGLAAPKGIDGFKKKEDEWECTSCMVRNPSNKQRCVCCEAPKPCDKPVPSAQAMEVPKFSFGIENGLINGHGFVFGIPANSSAKKEDKPSEVDGGATVPSIFGGGTKTNAAAAETSNTQFSFGIKSHNGAKSTLPTIAATETKTDSKPSDTAPAATTFSFGIPPATAAKKRAATDDATTVPAETIKKSDTKMLFPITPINGDVSKSEKVVDPPKFSFGTISTTPATTNTNTASTFAFTALKTTQAAAASSAFTATPSSDKSAAKPFAFGATPSFNSTEPAKLLSTGPGFRPQKPTFGTSAPAFGSTATTNATFSFNAPPANNNAFESATPPQSTTPAFGGASGMTFGSNSTPSATVTFGAGKTDAPTFGSASTTPAFGTASSTFAKPAANGVFGFGGGAGSNQTGEAAKPAFNFGGPSSTPASSGFKFGATNTTQNANGGFNFGSGSNNTPAVPSFNAEVKPTFNFTAGATPTTFSAQGISETKAPPGRVIRRAIRRTQR